MDVGRMTRVAMRGGGGGGGHKKRFCLGGQLWAFLLQISLTFSTP